jgi:localization factor PodJL
MKLDVPWSVKGIRPAARETAKEAARRAGVPLSEWLNSVIISSAADEGIDPASFELDDESGGDIAAVHSRLDDLTRKIDRLTTVRSGPDAYAPPHVRTMRPPYIPPAPQMPPARSGDFDRAAAEIAARQRALNGEPARQAATPHAEPTPQVAAMPAPPPAQDLFGLEEQLNRITDQIETLRKPGVEEAINALRGELAEIGHALNDALPRQALDTIERQVQGLSQRIAEGRQAGADGDALHGIEQGLAEVRDALHHLTPAENLIGFNEAVGVLAEKIDLIVAQKDPATLQQLDSAITTLRGISTHIASNETVRQLSDDVALLAEKVDRIANADAAGEALASLEHRIGALADALAERSQNGGAVPRRLEALVDSLSTKIDQIQLSRGDSLAVGHLEDTIVKLVERLDASDNRLGNLEAIERGLADLLVHISDMRAQKGEAGIRSDAPAGVDALKHDLARIQDTLDKLTGTLSHVVDRLATIEHGILGERPEAPLELDRPLTMPVGRIAARPVPIEPAMAPPPAPPPPAAPRAAAPAPAAPTAVNVRSPPEAKRAPLPGRNRPPINPDLPPDLPLEPGSGPPTMRGTLAARIATSEAALGNSNPPAAAGPAGKSGFLNAARRAAQTAQSQPAPRATTWTDDGETADGAPPSLRKKLTKRVKSLFVAASVIAIVISGLQIGSSYFNLWQTGPQTQSSRDTRLNGDAKVARDVIGERAPATVAATESKAGPPLPGSLPPTTAFGIADAPTVPFNPQMPTAALGSDSALTGPTPFDTVDITGSISKPAKRVAPSEPPALMPAADKLPIAIGGAALRSAAGAGNAAAAYEVAVRFAEGHGVPINVEEAARWFDKAARDGLAPAQFRLGSLYEKGNGVKKDLAHARKLYSAAATQGNAKAMHNLAVLYAEGIDGKPDYAAAASWFQKAAARGISDSQYNLGILCARGLGTEKSLVESYKWFALAADQGDREAAKMRDEIATKLDPKALGAMQNVVRAWIPEPQPAAATAVPTPESGWDHASTEAAPAAKRKIPDSFEIGKR